MDPRSAPPPHATAAGDLDVVRRQEGPDRIELVLRGELDITTSPVAEREIGSAQDERPAVLVLDLTGLTYLDSSGIRTVLLTQGHGDETGQKVAIRLGRGMARRLFDMLGLTDRFDVLDAHHEADADTDHPPGTNEGRSRG